MIHFLNKEQREHLRKVRSPSVPHTVSIHDAEYDEHYEAWRRTLPEADHDELHKKTLASALWRNNVSTIGNVTHQHSAIKWELRILAVLIFLLLALLLVRPAKAQFSKVNSISFQDSSGNQISGAFFTYPFTIKCLANISCVPSGSVLSINATSGGSGCTLPGGSGLLLFDNVTSCGDVTKWSTNGTTTITAAATAILDLSTSALVKQRLASGLTTTVNGDLGYDTLNNKWQIWQNGANKNLIAASNLGTSGQPCLSNADGSCTFADPVVSQPTASLLNAQVVGNVASAASDSGNPVKTGGVFNTTQPTVTTGQRVDTQSTARGALIISSGVDTVHVTVDAAPTTTITGSVTANAGTNLNTSLLQLDATGQASLVVGGGTTAPSKVQMVGGKTNDGTPQYDIMPEGAGGRSVIVEGFAGGTAVPVSGTFFQTTQPVSCTAANCAINVAQVAGAALGSTAVTNFGAAPAAAAVPGVNSSLFIGTAAPDTNTGNASAQTQRVVLATNQPTVPVSGDTNGCDGSTGSAVPAKGCYDTGNGSGNLTGRLQCDGYAFYDASTNGATQLVALVSGKTIFVCGYSFSSSSATANTLKLVYGTGSNCATGQTSMTPGIVLQAAASTGPIGKVIPPTGFVNGLKTAASNALCVLTNAAQAAQAEVWYTQF